jgi:hypothetical protein
VTRTPGQRFRKPLLYPSELQGRRGACSVVARGPFPAGSAGPVATRTIPLKLNPHPAPHQWRGITAWNTAGPSLLMPPGVGRPGRGPDAERPVGARRYAAPGGRYVSTGVCGDIGTCETNVGSEELVGSDPPEGPSTRCATRGRTPPRRRAVRSTPARRPPMMQSDAPHRALAPVATSRLSHRSVFRRAGV